MQEYIEHNGILLNQYEWSGGLSMAHKEVKNNQKARRREVKKGFAKIVKGD